MISSQSEAARLHGQRPGDRDALLLTAGKLARIGGGAVGQSHAFQELHRPPAGCCRRSAQHVAGRLHDVFRRGEVRKQLKVLKDHPHHPADPLRFGRMGAMHSGVQHVRPHADPAGVEGVQPVDATQEGRFSAAAGPHQGHRLVRADR